MGLPHDNCILVDTKGVIYQGRTEGMNQWKSAHAARTKARTLAEALKGADVFFGLSVKGRGDAGDGDIHGRRSRSSSPWPIPIRRSPRRRSMPCARTPSSPPAARTIPNQVNNVLGFPYIFRGALDVRASTINEQMKIAAAQALAELAREDVPDEVDAAYAGRRLRFGPDYIIPVPFDPRLISSIPIAVAKAAMESGVARKPILDLEAYRAELSGAARSHGRQPQSDLRAGAQQSAPRRLRRGRGGEGHPRRGRLP